MSQDSAINHELKTQSVIWNLQDLYEDSSSADIEKDFHWCRDSSQTLKEDYRGKVSTLDVDELLKLVTKLEELHTALGKLATYAFLNFTTQVNNPDAGSLYQKVQELASHCGRDTVFFELEWNLLKDEKAELFLQDTKLAHYRHYLLSMRRYRTHQLLENEEQLLLDLKPVGRSSWNTLFQKVIGNIRFGEAKRTEEEVLSDLYSNDREVRKNAAMDLTEGLQAHNHILTHIYNTQAAEKMISDRLRKYTTWVDSMNLDNQLSGGTVETLIGEVVSRYDIVQRYYRVKKNLLNLEEVVDYDRYAPLPSLPSKQLDWQTCKNIVLDSFAAFTPRVADIARRFFEENWIHAPVLQGKRGGAFAHPCVPQVHPYVMVNYTGTLRDISTVAHELGHGIHQVLAAKTGYYNSDTPLVLAETASVFAELLVFKAQLELLTDPKEKQAFICQKLESIFATVFRQTAMNRFEQLMHEGRRNEGELSSEKLSGFWLKTQREMFGDAVTLKDDYGIWWSYIPHFLSTPGYVYSYAFGELLVLSLYSVYQQDGSPFIDKYIALLSAGGSESPYDLVKPFGLDLNDPGFWQKGLGVIDSMLLEAEAM